MEYIDADKLKTWLENEADMEFKKTEENANSPVLCHFHNGCRMQALDTIDFITSLQQEQPKGGCSEKPNNLLSERTEEDLEKEMDKYFSNWLQGASDEGCFNADSQLVSIYDCRRIARHFYELRLKARKEE